MLTPPSRSRPRPSLSRGSITAASRGRFDTISLPVSFSNQRKPGICRDAPCRMPAWAAGVVDGRPVCQPRMVWLPDRSQCPMVGRLPARTAQRSTGSATPSSCTISMPGSVPGRGRRKVRNRPPAWRACRRRTARIRRLASLTNVSSVPLSAIQSRIAAKTTARIAATTRVGRPLIRFAGSSSSATTMTTTWATTPSSMAPQPPSAVTPTSSSGRSTAPTAATSTTRPSVSTMSALATPGISHSVTVSTTNVTRALRNTARIRLQDPAPPEERTQVTAPVPGGIRRDARTYGHWKTIAQLPVAVPATLSTTRHVSPSRADWQSCSMEVTGFFTAIIIGLIIGALGRLVVPGKQNIPIWLTLLIGVVAALLGTLLAGALGVADTPGIDWIELILQIGFAAVGVAIVAGMQSSPPIAVTAGDGTVRPRPPSYRTAPAAAWRTGGLRATQGCSVRCDPPGGRRRLRRTRQAETPRAPGPHRRPGPNRPTTSSPSSRPAASRR